VAPRLLLDTNVVSHVARFPQGAVADRIADVGERQVCTSIVVAAELRYGVARRGAGAGGANSGKAASRPVREGDDSDET